VVLSKYGIGTERIDVASATQLGILVTHTPVDENVQVVVLPSSRGSYPPIPFCGRKKGQIVDAVVPVAQVARGCEGCRRISRALP
jgi:hypothetical protein